MAYDEALAERVREALKGFVYVGGQGVAEDEDLRSWVEAGTSHAESLPPE